MEPHVLEYIEDIKDYSARPTLALYAASRLADDIVNGRLEDWRAAYWAPFRYTLGLPLNPALQLLDEKVNTKTVRELDATRERCLFTEGFRKMYGHALFEYRERFAVGELQPDTYWHATDGDLSAAGLEAEEKFE